MYSMDSTRGTLHLASAQLAQTPSGLEREGRRINSLSTCRGNSVCTTPLVDRHKKTTTQHVGHEKKVHAQTKAIEAPSKAKQTKLNAANSASSRAWRFEGCELGVYETRAPPKTSNDGPFTKK